MQEVCNNKKGQSDQIQAEAAVWVQGQLLTAIVSLKPKTFFHILSHNQEYHHGRNNLKYPDIILALAPEGFFFFFAKPDVGDDEVIMTNMEMSETNRQDNEMASWQTELLNG